MRGEHNLNLAQLIPQNPFLGILEHRPLKTSRAPS